jgi:hypothetical protein
VASVARARIEQSERVDEGPRVDRALYRSIIGRRGAVAAALLQATSLSFLVTAVAIGLELGESTRRRRWFAANSRTTQRRVAGG